MTNTLRAILLVALFCLIMAAVLPTWDWFQCSRHAGGTACTPSPMAANAGRAWAQNASTLLALAVPCPGGNKR